ncbi:hypothetical protein [Caballeronia glathei]|uniref:hypothetical protein n=1 Tax=Caballeronia glathei TaxID=60547 RepID=UPI000A6D3A91|nr:hypothetical protein [Caballeronia glathei]
MPSYVQDVPLYIDGVESSLIADTDTLANRRTPNHIVAGCSTQPCIDDHSLAYRARNI